MMSRSMVFDGANIEERFLATIGMTERTESKNKRKSGDIKSPLQMQAKRFHGSGGEFANVDFDARAESFARGLQEPSGDLRADVGLAAVIADLRGYFADHQSRAVPLKRNGGMPFAGFT